MTKKKVTFCENHPDIATSDTCEICGKNICYNCRKIFVNRIFCSRKCISQFVSEHARRLLIKAFRKFIWILTWPFHGLLKIQKWRALEWGLVLGLAFSIYLNLQMKKELFLLRSSPETEQEAQIDTTGQLPAKVFHPAEGGMVQSNRIDISGEAEANWIISLSRDGQVISAKLPENGQFNFTNVRLYRGQNELVVRALSQDGKAVVLQRLNLTYGTPTLQYLMHDVKRGSRKVRQVAFTFDGGAENNVADEILDYLKASGIKSTFFLTGRFIQRFPNTVRRIVAEGHEVGNHTLNHPHLTSFAENRRHNTLPDMNKKRLQNELIKTEQIFEILTKKKMAKLWRAPYGEYNSEILKWAAEAGYRHVGWTVGRGWEENMDTLDWVADKNSRVYFTAEQIAKRILSYASNKKDGANGAIILMHLGSNRKDDYPHQKLPEIIQGLQKKGYEAVRISEMLSHP